MAFKRKFTKKPKKRTRWQNYGIGAKQLWKDVKKLKGMLNVEYKNKEVGTGTTATTTGNLTLLNGLTKGDDYDNRDGRQVRWKSIQASLAFIKDVNVAYTRVRYAIVLDRDASNTVNSASMYSNEYASFRELSNRRRFTFLKEGVMVLNVDNPTKIIDFYKFLDIKTVFDDSNNGDITDIRTNAIYLYLWSDQGTYVPQIGITTRLRYIDN